MSLPFARDAGSGHRAALGLIVLQQDETLEPELRSVFADEGIAIYHARIPSDPDVTPDTLRAMAAALPETAALLPRARAFDAIAYCCTSGATLIGQERVAELVRASHPNALVTDPVTAVIAACRRLGVARLAMITPYVAAVSEALRSKLAANGLAIAAFGSFEQQEEAVVARITPESVRDAMLAIGAAPDADAVFASCTNLRSFSVIAEAEAALGKPVITSNQALAWHLMMLTGLPTQGAGPGWLFDVWQATEEGI